MRTAFGCAAAVALSAALAAASPQPPGSAQGAAVQPTVSTPAFRAGIDVLTVEVAALDGDGRPLPDLRASDFAVRIDGQPRRVISADLVRLDVPDPAAPVSAPVRTTASRGRRIVIAIDQLQIRPGAITPLLAAAARFVERLPARDQVSVVAFPEPGARLDFTNDKARVRQVLQAALGTPPVVRSTVYNLSVYDAVAISERERTTIAQGADTSSDPPTVAEALRQGCTAAPDDGRAIDACRMQLLSEASATAQRARADAAISVRAIRSIVDQLGAVDGPKTLLLVSAGLLVNDPSEIDALARAAETSQTSIHVLAVDPDRTDGIALDVSGNRRRETGDDRRLRLEGLVALAAPGALYQIEGSGDGVFARIASELSAYYLLAVESREGDEQRPSQKVDVTVQRRGVRTRSSLAFARPPSLPARPAPGDRLQDALASRTALTEVPIALATFARRDPSSDRVRLDLATRVSGAGASHEIDIGYVVLNEAEAVVASYAAPQQLPPAGPEAIEITMPLLLDPGVYSLRMGVVDAEGRRGTVVRTLTVERFGGPQVTVSDLLVSDGPPTAQTLRPSIDTRVSSGRLGAYVELYSSTREDLEWTAVEFEIAESEDGPAVVAESAALDDGVEPSSRVASAALDVTALPAGRYVVRARAELDGATVAARVQPIVIDATGQSPSR